MKDRAKRTATERRNDDASFFYYSTTSDHSCRKHPSVSAVGICPYCLNDRLVNLVCSECGEQRLSSCSCSSDISPNGSSNAGNVVLISSFIDEEATKQRKKTEEKSRKTEEVTVFKRSSSSSCVEISKRKHHHHRLSKIGRFLKKINLVKDRALDRKKQSVSRSRSLCSYRGGNGCFIGSEEDVSSSYSGARSSFSAARSSSVNGGLGIFDKKTEHGKSNFSETEYPGKSNFSETEYTRRESTHPRRSNYEAAAARKSDSLAMSFTKRVLSVKESYFTGGDEEEFGFIEIKFNSSGKMVNDGVLEHGGGGSCRLTTEDREVSKSRRSFKGWKWIFGHHHHQRDS